jgi:hypothetical protein
MKGLSVQGSAVGSVAQAEALVGKAAAAGITALFYNVSAAYVPSSSFDRLGALIAAGHAAGLEVGVWLCPGADPYFTRRWPVSGGGFTDYGNVNAREAMAEGVAGLVERYGIDIVITDYIRVPSIDSTVYSADDVTAAVYGMEAAAGDERAFCVTVKPYKNDWSRWGQDWPMWIKTWLAQGKRRRYAVPMVYSPTKYGDFAPHVRAWLDAGVPLEAIMPEMSVINTQIAGEKTPKELAAWTAEFDLWRSVGVFNLAAWDQRILDLPEHLAIFSGFELAEAEQVPAVDLEAELTMLWATAADLREIAAVQAEQVTALQEDAAELERQVEGVRGKLGIKN